MVVDKNVWDFYKTVSELSYPVQVQLNITNKCINRCQMCRKYKWPQIDIPVAKLREIADELRRMETGLIILSGGEPFLHRDIERILDIFEDMTTLVFTSGVVPISVDKFKKLKKVQFSLDALAPELYRVIRGPGNVETVKENILKAKEAGCEVTVTTVIQKTNIFHVPDIIEFCEQEGIAFLPSVVHSYDELAFYNVKKRPLPPLCVVPFYHCLIDPAGDIFVCCHHHEDNTDYENIDRRFVLGNIFDCSFSEIWFSNKAKYIKRWLYNNRASFCNGCYRHLLENDVASFIRTCSTSVDLPFTHTYFFPLEMIASSRIFEHV
jgi:MoaA/NifB/PqqE/SkfB family radical SAM enzyme